MATARHLSSWKEIAAYMGKGVRTVQRWERELGLPVRRPNGVHRHIVIAIPEELDVWLIQKCGVNGRNGVQGRSPKRNDLIQKLDLQLTRTQKLLAEMKSATLQQRQLVQQVRELRSRRAALCKVDSHRER